MSESALRDLEVREQRVRRFCAVVASELHLQLAVRQITTVDELTAFSRRHRVPIDHMDVALFYRMFDHPFWPWYGKPKQVRRHFAHLGRLPGASPDCMAPETAFLNSCRAPGWWVGRAPAT